jgi:hypothetical protein
LGASLFSQWQVIFVSIPDFLDVIKQIGVLVPAAYEHLIVHQVKPEFPL